MLGRHVSAQTSLEQLHFYGDFDSDHCMRGVNKLCRLRSLVLPVFDALMGELPSEVAQLTNLETLNMNKSWVSETSFPLSTALSLLCGQHSGVYWPVSGLRTDCARGWQ